MDNILKAADDILRVFDSTAEWLDSDESAIVNILKALVEKNLASINKQSKSCSCDAEVEYVPSSVRLCRKCGMPK
jgi:hypothetical protein